MHIDDKIFKEIYVVPASEYQIIVPEYGEYMQTQYNQDDRNLIYGLITNKRYNPAQLKREGIDIDEKFEMIKENFDNETGPAIGLLSQNSLLYDALVKFDKIRPKSVNWKRTMDWEQLDPKFFMEEFGVNLNTDTPLLDETLIIFYDNVEDIDHQATLFNDPKNTVPAFFEFINA